MMHSDDELLRRMSTGDDQAFALMYRRHQGAIYRFALLMSGSAALAEDVTQETFLFLLGAAQRYDPARGTLSAYLYGIARNHVLRRLGRDRAYVSLAAEEEEGDWAALASLIANDDPARDYARQQVMRLVRQAVLALPPRYREVIVLCDFQELSYADAALALGCAVGTVSSRLHRGHALLLESLRTRGKAGAATHAADLLRCFS